MIAHTSRQRSVYSNRGDLLGYSGSVIIIKCNSIRQSLDNPVRNESEAQHHSDLAPVCSADSKASGDPPG